MIDVAICGINLFCYLKRMDPNFNRPKYPPEVSEICQFYEESKLKLPDECKWKTYSDIPPPRRRNEF